ncbi:NAD(P)-dependent oxidoreductase [Liquorilactobacillus sicerae]|uniref:NAD(P)-dependent oxidoreductase n=1 Tax=Liquorilactobacillus sicerae TaxID=1416943 RepID=UPI00247FB8FE|nr:NAD(P)-dependent oxidoreductase [Liquorilactobacillus sicerae]
MDEKAPLFWIIDEEWTDYELEKEIIYKNFSKAIIKHSNYDYKDDLKKFGKKVDAIIAQVYAEIPNSTIDYLESCKGIAIFGGGYDKVDILEARKNNIPVTNVKNYCKEDIAEYVLNSILFSLKPLNTFFNQIKKGNWGYQTLDKLPSRVNNQTLLIIGFGRIGSYVAEKALKIGMKVIAFDPKLEAGQMIKKEVQVVGLEEGLRKANFISIHCNLTKKTENLIDKYQFSLMKKDCVLINTSRGKVINEDELIKAVKLKRIKGAILDVIAEEPPRNLDLPILQTKGIIVTPHISYLSSESITELKKRATENAIAMYKGEFPNDVVNFK